jgi:hypothetical protein
MLYNQLSLQRTLSLKRDVELLMALDLSLLGWSLPEFAGCAMKESDPCFNKIQYKFF